MDSKSPQVTDSIAILQGLKVQAYGEAGQAYIDRLQSYADTLRETIANVEADTANADLMAMILPTVRAMHTDVLSDMESAVEDVTQIYTAGNAIIEKLRTDLDRREWPEFLTKEGERKKS